MKALPLPCAFRDRVNGYVAIKAKDSSVRVEILGGVSTVLAMSYIVLGPRRSSRRAGIPWSAAFTATVLVAGVAIIAMGMWARLPFTVAPGMEINALVVFSVVGVYGFSWPLAPSG